MSKAKPHPRSSLSRLAPELRALADRLLREDQLTVMEITAALNDKGAEVSKSAIGRYAKRLREREEGLNDLSVAGLPLATAVYGVMAAAPGGSIEAAEAARDVLAAQMKVLRALKRLQRALDGAKRAG